MTRRFILFQGQDATNDLARMVEIQWRQIQLLLAHVDEKALTAASREEWEKLIAEHSSLVEKHTVETN